MKNITLVIVALAVGAFAGCATADPNVASKAATFSNSATGQALQSALVSAALTAATQYATYNEIDAPKVVAATLDGSADSVRSLVATPKAESPGAIARAVENGSGVRAFDNTVAPIVAGVVMRQIQSGIPPEQAIENVATAMNKAAEKARQ